MSCYYTMIGKLHFNVLNLLLFFYGVPYNCLSTNLNWLSPPTVATNQATGHIILHANKMKTLHSRWTLQNLNSPIPVEKLVVQPKVPKLSDRITDYFQKTDPIRATLISGTTLLIVLIIALPCAVRCCCPQVFRLCGPITYLRKQYSKRKLKKSLE